MPSPVHSILIAAAAVALAGCAAQQRPATGPHLVYRNAQGTPTMQVDYPSADMCAKVEAISGGDAKCQVTSEARQLHAHATLRYSPGDFSVEAHYADLASCQRVNSRMAAGVRLEKPCSAP